MINGGTRDNNKLIIEKNKITKIYKKNALVSFLKELYVYLLAKKLKLKFIPKMLSYDLENKIIVIENEGISMNELCKKKKCKKKDFLPDIRKIYNKLVDLGIYHNDIRYRNVLYNEKKKQFYLIDFEWIDTIFKDNDYEGLLKQMKNLAYKPSKNKKTNEKPKTSRTNKKTKKKKYKRTKLEEYNIKQSYLP